MNETTEVTGRLRRRLPDLDWADKAAVVVAGAAVLPLVARAIRVVRIGYKQSTNDLREYWQPIAERVLDGTPLYTEVSVSEYKPPTTFLFTIAGELLGSSFLLWLLLVAVANVVLVWLTFRVSRKLTGAPVPALVGSVLVLFALAKLTAYANNKTVVGALVLLAVLTRSPWRAGALVGIAGGFVQYGLLAAPVVGWLWYEREGIGGAGKATGAVLSLFAVPFLVVGALGGVDAMVGGVKYTFWVIVPYVFEGQQLPIPDNVDVGLGSPFAQPGAWVARMGSNLEVTGPILAAATVGVFATEPDGPIGEPGTATLRNAVLLLVATGALAFAVRAYTHYWGLVLAPLGVFASAGVAALVRNVRSDDS
jgi:hypothetical protein